MRKKERTNIGESYDSRAISTLFYATTKYERRTRVSEFYSLIPSLLELALFRKSSALYIEKHRERRVAGRNPRQASFTRSTVTDTVARFKTTSLSSLFSKAPAPTIAFIPAATPLTLVSPLILTFFSPACERFLISRRKLLKFQDAARRVMSYCKTKHLTFSMMSVPSIKIILSLIRDS